MEWWAMLLAGAAVVGILIGFVLPIADYYFGDD